MADIKKETPISETQVSKLKIIQDASIVAVEKLPLNEIHQAVAGDQVITSLRFADQSYVHSAPKKYAQQEAERAQQTYDNAS